MCAEKSDWNDARGVVFSESRIRPWLSVDPAAALALFTLRYFMDAPEVVEVVLSL